MRRKPPAFVACVICEELRYSDRVTRCWVCLRKPVCVDCWDATLLMCVDCALARKATDAKSDSSSGLPNRTPPSVLGPLTEAGIVVLENSLGMRFVRVSTGRSGENVLFSQWETRVGDWRRYWATDEGKARGKDWQSPGFEQGEDHPVVGVSWDDAVAFCEWLTKEERKIGKIRPTAKYRLPTDAEWSWVVGLGEEVGKTPQEKDGKIKNVYPWGTEWPPPKGAGKIGREPGSGTAPVGSYTANAYGLFDMAGNVWEWCQDWYNAAETARVLRGGSWYYDAPAYLLSSFRFSLTPDLRFNYYGFRVVLSDDEFSR